MLGYCQFRGGAGFGGQSQIGEGAASGAVKSFFDLLNGEVV